MLTCAGCSKVVTDQYISALGMCWHESCFRCAHCRQPFGSEKFIEKGKLPYHVSCYREKFSPRCAGCNQVIDGETIQALGKTWHPHHFICNQCRQPITGGQYFVQDSRPYCQKDYLSLFGTRCSICNQPMQGKHLVDFWGNPYCPHHEKEFPRCVGCSRLICEALTGGGIEYMDGHYLCNICHPSAVENINQAQQIFRRVQRCLKNLGLDTGLSNIPLRLVSQRELKDQLKHHPMKIPNGLTRTRIHTRGMGEVAREVEEVQALLGLPTENLAAVYAHELMHTWLFLNRFPQLPEKVEEGLCELATFLWLNEQDSPQTGFLLKSMQENDDPVYGIGFRAALRSYKKHGLAAVLDVVRRNRGLP
jgi:hypothetical protein